MSIAELIARRLCQAGHEVFIVGGAVRDLLRGKTPEDEDLVTSARPEQIALIFADRKVQEVGKAFGVMLVDNIEVATYRTDRYFGGGDKDCEITFADTIEDDLARRDLTVNAMALCTRSGDLVDPHNGRQDLVNRTIRFVEDPYDQILADPNRIMRACRFLAALEGEFHPETLLALQRQSYRVKAMVAPERIRLEILKAMKLRRPWLFFQALLQIGVLKDILPDLRNCVDYPGGDHHAEDVFTHCMLVGDALSPKRPLLRLAGYLHDIGKPVTDKDGHFLEHEVFGAGLAAGMLLNLRFSAEEVKYVQNLILTHMRKVWNLTPRARRRLLATLHLHDIPLNDFLRLRVADRVGNLGKDNQSFGKLLQLYRQFKEVEKVPKDVNMLAVNGHDIMEVLNIPPGPIIKKVKQQLFDYVMEHGEEMNTRETLMGILWCMKVDPSLMALAEEHEAEARVGGGAL